MKKIKDYPRRTAAVAAVIVLFSTIPLSSFLVFYTLKGKSASAASPTIDISAEAVQKVHLGQVPHIDSNGNFKTVRDSSSFLPIGIYNPTLCQVTKSLTWNPGPADTPGWNGEYRIKVNWGSSRSSGTYLLADINVGNVLSGQVGNLPPSSTLYYSIWQNRTEVVVSEGVFTSDPCSNGQEDSNFQSIKNAGFNLAILEKNVYPDSHTLDKAQESGLKLLLDLRDRPDGVFSSLNGNPNVFGYYVGDDDLARVWATGGDPTNVYNSLKTFADSIDGQTTKPVLEAEPDVYSDPSPSWKNWYRQFDAIGNISFHYNYPKTSTSNTIKTQADAVKNQVLVNGSGRPSWFISQAINLKWVFPLEFPTMEEGKAMAYSAIIHGATGLFQFSYDGWLRRQPKGSPAPQNIDDINWYDRHAGIKANTPYNYPGSDKSVYTPSSSEILLSIGLWNALDASQNGVNKQLADLKDVILSPTATEDYKVFVDQAPISSAPIRTMLKKYNGDYYLLAVNIDKASINTKFDFLNTHFTSGQVLFENRNVSLVDGNKIEENFAPFAVHVYKLVQDSDGDSISDGIDNCPSVANADQANYNGEPTLIPDDKANFDDGTNPIGDKIGDACDGDIDHDGLPNGDEASRQTSPTNRDSDDDGYPDGVEVICSSDPKNNTSTPVMPDGVNKGLDTDHDGLPDTCEGALGSNPNLTDTDGDKVNDSVESRWATNLLEVDTDGDSCTDNLEIASVNGDRKVSSVDLSQTAQHYSGSKNDPLYYYTFDVNLDGKISSIDLGQIAQNFGDCPS